ncbi:M20 family metallo-hydrolase [Elioraea thermophila]|uniref:M20 family metallo-hydrolase n=1 Tax=Elioraea thermophila TaxID=2185104 RepID=UPI000DF27290|nr:M20 family metallo-hydrolase [Elioraea thermophila]
MVQAATEADAARAVERDRLWRRLMEMGRIGGFTTEDGHEGVNRPCLSPLDREARRLLIGWAKAAGLAVAVDPAANLFLRLEGQDPSAAPVLTGSHMDTQPQGGRFDGIYGVLAGLEAVEAIIAAGVRPRRPIEVVAWTNEEGGRFAPGCTGSMSFTKAEPMETFDDIRDAEGIRYADALAEQLALEADLPSRPLGYVPHAYVEAHIEQGPRLEAEGKDIGVVTGIQGCRWFTVTVEGRTDHAGTTPLRLRKDAVQDAIRAIQALNALMHDPDDVLRFTVGSFRVKPDTSNSVAREVVFTIDFRHPDARVLRERGDAVAETVARAMTTCTARVHERFNAAPADFGPLVPDLVERAARDLGLSIIRMPSGAFHDAQFLSRICPTGMIFIPCRGGVSHHPSEYATPEACANGARVLARVLCDLAGV